MFSSYIKEPNLIHDRIDKCTYADEASFKTIQCMHGSMRSNLDPIVDKSKYNLECWQETVLAHGQLQTHANLWDKSRKI